jgi:alanine racemase
MNNHVSVLEIDGKALEHNLNYFKNKLNEATKILAVVKAFGYGSDGVLVAEFLKNKVDYFAVAYAHEGIAIREANIKTPILVLHPQINSLKDIIAYNLEPNLYNFKILNSFLDIASKKGLKQYPIHLKFNTGLNRLGFKQSDISNINTQLKETNAIKIQSLFSHLAASEDLNEKEFSKSQLKSFSSITKEFLKLLDYKPLLHILNTSGVVNYANAQFDMVRIGLGLYGFGNDLKETKQLKNTHHLKSIISQIHSLKKGESVGYNRAFVAKKPSRSATIPVGHADGLSRKLGNGKGYVLIHNQKANIIGNVCMDMIMVDVSAIDCSEGDEVIIFNHQEMLQHISNVSDTIVYETLTSISPRVKKMLKK